MLQTKRLFICFAVLYLHSYFCVSEHRNFKKEWKFHRKALFRYGRHIASEANSFLFAVCSEDKLPREMNCNVTIDTPILPWNVSNTHRQTCHLKLVGSEKGEVKHEITGISSLDRLTRNRAIMVWWERRQDSQFKIQNIIVSVINMAKCTTIHLSFPIEEHGMILLGNVVIYSNSFDVTISNIAICKNTPTCRITYDVEGKQIGYPAPFIPIFTSVHTEPVAALSPNKGFYACGVDSRSWRFKAMHVSPTGHGVNLMRVTVSDPTKIHYAVSNAHELYGICLMDQKRAFCAQLDASANVKMNATMRIPGHAQDAHWIGVHNLKDGGILLLTGKCSGYKCRKFRIIRVLDNGEEEKEVDQELNIKCSNVPDQLSVEVAEYENDFCFYFACSHTLNTDGKIKSSVKLVSKCVTKSDLMA
ncbi:uncharacterized protein LOC100678658 [Nasonia vitripennis]|uniref:Uncharacterized protein n=1 Tax=Nasonia vitripennis TaxID=7425 RepID=A0A7M7GIU1_NASVI|nr:uncharacterized protein LOC100678658 [Nasonia vitripennis]